MIDNRPMRVELAVLRHVEMPLKFRFRTSFGETGVKKFLLLELRAEGLSGWGECVAEESAVLFARDDVHRVFDSHVVSAAARSRQVRRVTRRVRAPRGAHPRKPDGESRRRVRAPRPLREGGGRPPGKIARWFPREDRGRRLARDLAHAEGNRRERESTRGAGLPPHQAEDRAGLGSGSARGRARLVPRHHAHGRRERGLHTRAGGDAARSRRVPARLRGAAAAPRGPGPTRGAREDAEDADLPRRVDPLSRPTRKPPSTSAPARSSTSRSAASAGTARPCGFTTPRAPWECRFGAGACSRPESGAPTTSPSRASRASRSRATRRRRRATSRRTSWRLALEAADGLMPVPKGPGIGVAIRPDVLSRVTTGIQELRA